jgi:hypothetical protein
MARSTYIWLVQNPANGLLTSAFTVKYEMLNWVEKNHAMGSHTTVHRLSDGALKDPEEITGEVLAALTVT